MPEGTTTTPAICSELYSLPTFITLKALLFLHYETFPSMESVSAYNHLCFWGFDALSSLVNDISFNTYLRSLWLACICCWVMGWSIFKCVWIFMMCCVCVCTCSSGLSLLREVMHAHTAEIVEIHGCQCQRIWPEAAEINDSADLFIKNRAWLKLNSNKMRKQDTG